MSAHCLLFTKEEQLEGYSVMRQDNRNGTLFIVFRSDWKYDDRPVAHITLSKWTGEPQFTWHDAGMWPFFASDFVSARDWSRI